MTATTPKPAAKPDRPSIADFTPTKVDFDAVQDGKTAETVLIEPAPKPTEPKVVAKEPDKTDVPDIDGRIGNEPPLKPDPKPAEQPPKKGDAMRTQLEKLAAEKKELEERFATLQSERDAKVNDLTKLSTDFEQRELELQKLKSQQVIGNPMEHPSVKAIYDGWNKDADSFAVDIESLTGNGREDIFKKLTSASQKLAGLAPQSQEYRDALASVRNDLGEAVGGDNLREALRLVREGASKIPEIQDAVRRLKDEAPLVQYEGQKANYEQALQEYMKVESSAFNPDAATISSDPLHHSVIMKAMIDGSEEVKTASERAKAFARLVLLPLPPINPADLAEIPAEQRQAKLAAHAAQQRGARAKLSGVLAEALLARQLLPGLYKRLSEAELLLKGERQVTRGKPEEHKKVEQAPAGPADPKGFQPVKHRLEDFEE